VCEVRGDRGHRGVGVTLQRLVLLRHGQTDFNLAGRMQGHLDSLLTEGGREQAALVAPQLARLGPARLISSDLRRAIDTADVVGVACALPVKLDPRLRETHLGEWQGRSVTEVEAEWPGAIAEWRSDPAWTPPGGESRVDVVARARPVVDELDAEFDAPDDLDVTALLVAHGGLIAGLVSGLLELPTSAWPAIGGIGNCRWAVLARRADHPRWRLTGYNVGAG
jgi:broad specificity phosphatase PhoE